MKFISMTYLKSCFFALPRTDYWVSQSRKYCEFCKCWITDNKPSVDFHEKGRRHQENVKKRLQNISRTNTQHQKSADRIDATIKQMEFAALEAYKKDSETQGDLSSMLMRQNQASSSGITKLWNEAKTRDGKSYYINIMTRETVWQPPSEGYNSLAEQREQSEQQAQKQLKELEKFRRKEAMMTMQKVQHEEAEAAARLAREKMKARRVEEADLGPETCGPLLEPGKTDPYGRWQTVKETPVVDLQLPAQDYYYYEAPPVEFEPEPIVREFKEKVVETIVSSEAPTFKKRKLNSSTRNVRQRLDDD